ncbi:MAG: PA14 domain-containing protein [Planctomycetota bacterium]|jgi:hypothetical protein
MNRNVVLELVAFSSIVAVVSCSGPVNVENARRPGLVGAWYSRMNFTNIKQLQVIRTLELTADSDEGVVLRGDHGQEWAARWDGFILAPASGEITFQAKTPESVLLEIGGKRILELKRGQGEGGGSIRMDRDKAYPIRVAYIHNGGKVDGILSIRWSWTGQDQTSIPAASLSHTAQQVEAIENEIDRALDDEPGTVPPLMVPARNVVVYYEAGRFAGWPANAGLWSWGNEIVVGSALAYYKENKLGHSNDPLRGLESVLARSMDGGETWTIEDFTGPGGQATSCPGGIDFTHRDFAIKCSGGKFLVSYDRCRNWQGPYQLPDIGKPLTARTDYIVNGPSDCLFFLSAKEERVQAGIQDRAFCARTTDGGKNINFVSWITQNIAVRSVMPSTVRISENHLVTAMRRRRDDPVLGRDKQNNWIDCSLSYDDGNTWTFLSKVADTDTGKRNGNPPSLVRLRDGRLCVTYGYRATPQGIRAKISSDNGKTWSEEIGLRVDGRHFDLGYPRSMVRPDGRIVTIYYYTTEQMPEQHIAATIWDPDLVCKSAETQ